MPSFTESLVEEAALDWFRALGYVIVSGPDTPPVRNPSARRTPTSFFRASCAARWSD